MQDAGCRSAVGEGERRRLIFHWSNDIEQLTPKWIHSILRTM
jgi:hypothetical protein